MVAARIPGHPALLEVSAWHGSDLQPPPLPPPTCPRISRLLDMGNREHAVYVWVWRYVELYGTGPTASQVADGVGMLKSTAKYALADMAAAGCMVRVGDNWIPTRSP